MEEEKTQSIEDFLAQGGEIQRPEVRPDYERKWKWNGGTRHIAKDVSAKRLKRFSEEERTKYEPHFKYGEQKK